MLHKLLEELTQVRIRKRRIVTIIGTALVPLGFAWGQLDEAPKIVYHLAWGVWLVIVLVSLVEFLIEVWLHIRDLLKNAYKPSKDGDDKMDLSLGKMIMQAIYETLLDNIIENVSDEENSEEKDEDIEKE